MIIHSKEDEERMREEIDTMESMNLSKQIRETSEEIAKIVQQLQSGKLSEEDTLNLEIKRDELFAKGDQLSKKRKRIFAERGIPIGKKEPEDI